MIIKVLYSTFYSVIWQSASSRDQTSSHCYDNLVQMCTKLKKNGQNNLSQVCYNLKCNCLKHFFPLFRYRNVWWVSWLAHRLHYVKVLQIIYLLLIKCFVLLLLIVDIFYLLIFYCIIYFVSYFWVSNLKLTWAFVWSYKVLC